MWQVISGTAEVLFEHADREVAETFCALQSWAVRQDALLVYVAPGEQARLVYVVHARWGEYDDAADLVLRVFTRRERAEKFVRVATRAFGRDPERWGRVFGVESYYRDVKFDFEAVKID